MQNLLIPILLLLASCTAQPQKSASKDICPTLPQIHAAALSAQTPRELMTQIKLSCVIDRVEQFADSTANMSEHPQTFRMLSDIIKVSDGAVWEIITTVLESWWNNQTSEFVTSLYMLNQQGDQTILAFFLMDLVELYKDESLEKMQETWGTLSDDHKLFLLEKAPIVFGNIASTNQEYSMMLDAALGFATETEKLFQQHKESLKLGSKVEPYTQLRKIEDKFYEDHLFPLFPAIAQQICLEHKDNLFQKLVTVILANQGSAAEDYANVLGEILICKPDFLLNYVANHDQYRFLMRDIDFGFRNYVYGKQQQDSFQVFRMKLDSINAIAAFRD